MEKIDSINQYYMKNIDFSSVEESRKDQKINISDLNSIIDISRNIEILLEDSLNSNDPFLKLDLVIKAYSNMIYILNYYNPENIQNKKIFH
jgi:hypothetical protein